MKFTFLLLAAITQVQTQDSDGYTDENRPYKFAFNIEGYQHRSEEKDEKGIVKGEYGFVTGDGVYHVTVYATDENGNFRIISMKNYYIGLPNEPTTSAPEKTTPPTTTQTQPTIRKLDGIQGCGGCLVPTTTRSISKENSINEVNNIDVRLGNDRKDTPKQKINHMDISRSKPTTDRNFMPKSTTNSINEEKGITYLQPNHKTTTILPITKKPISKKNQSEKSGVNNQHINPGKSKTPNLPGDKTPSEIQTQDPSGLLYEFNQTQTFQGHHEKGFRDSSKQGDYFVNGRDGVRQIVEYIANDSGYQPHVRFQNISASDTPNPDTEKLTNVLKGVYFKWFYKK